MSYSLSTIALILSIVNARFDFNQIYSTDLQFSKASKPQLYDQKLDHFNAYNADKTFKQRWCYNDEYWTGSNEQGPLLFVVGGEGGNNCGFYGFVTEFAKEVGGLLLTAEHRFYGESMPFGTSDIDNNYMLDSNHLGLFSEDIDFKSKRLLGNFPQAYSHLALIDTALSFNLAS